MVLFHFFASSWRCSPTNILFLSLFCFFFFFHFILELFYNEYLLLFVFYSYYSSFFFVFVFFISCLEVFVGEHLQKWNEKKDNPLPLSSQRCSPTSIMFFQFSSLQWISPIYLLFSFLFILFPFFSTSFLEVS